MRQEFTIPLKLPSLNEVIGVNRGNKYVGAKMKRDIQADIGWIIKAACLRPCTKPVEIYLTFFEANRRRDVDNIISSTKFILDALVDAKILPDDSQKWVEQIHPLVRHSEEYAVEVVLEDCDM